MGSGVKLGEALQTLSKREIVLFPFKMKMDLEVTESMDLSPGDHQHLVQKAADDDTQTPFGQAYATPPAAGPRQTHGNPNTKANQRTDTYAVQISDEGSPDNSNTVTGLLAQVSVRRAFIIKVFLILSAQLVVTGAIINMFLFWNLRHQVPANYILRGLFNNNTDNSWRSAARSHNSCDFTLLNGVLLVLVFVLITYGISYCSYDHIGCIYCMLDWELWSSHLENEGPGASSSCTHRFTCLWHLLHPVNWLPVKSEACEGDLLCILRREQHRNKGHCTGARKESLSPSSPPTPHTQHSHLAAALQGASMGYKGSFYQKITTWFKN
ncbi:Protein lifeguard 1 [Manis javanica]|nr:Protein lifeguard 1 [Manis javanica]